MKDINCVVCLDYIKGPFYKRFGKDELNFCCVECIRYFDDNNIDNSKYKVSKNCCICNKQVLKSLCVKYECRCEYYCEECKDEFLIKYRKCCKCKNKVPKSSCVKDENTCKYYCDDCKHLLFNKKTRKKYNPETKDRKKYEKKINYKSVTIYPSTTINFQLC